MAWINQSCKIEVYLSFNHYQIHNVFLYNAVEVEEKYWSILKNGKYVEILCNENPICFSNRYNTYLKNVLLTLWQIVAVR